MSANYFLIRATPNAFGAATDDCLIWARLLGCNGACLRMMTLVRRLPLSQLIGVWRWRRKAIYLDTFHFFRAT